MEQELIEIYLWFGELLGEIVSFMFGVICASVMVWGWGRG